MAWRYSASFFSGCVKDVLMTTLSAAMPATQGASIQAIRRDPIVAKVMR